MNFKSKAFLVSLLIGVLLTSSSIGAHAKKDVIDRKLGKLPRKPKFPLLSKIRDVVSPSSRSAESTPPSAGPVPADDIAAMAPPEPAPEPEFNVEVEPKATGVRVISARAPSVDEVEPKVTGPLTLPPNCNDVPPDNVYTCEEQRDFGKCDAEFIVSGNYCALTCGRPPCPPVFEEEDVCDDVPPGPDYTCAEQREFGKCDVDFMVMGNYCARTCGRAPCPPIDETCTTISEGVEGSALLAFLDFALEVTGLKEAFDDPTLRVTVFAPTNIAFEDLLEDLDVSAEELLAFPGVIEEILGAHVLIEPVLSEDFEDGDMFEAMSELSDVEIAFADDGILVIPDYGLPAEVVSADLDACGSIVHVIDTVLIPDREILLALGLPDEVIDKYEMMAMKEREKI